MDGEVGFSVQVSVFRQHPFEHCTPNTKPSNVQMTTIRHRAISASAGSGKTFQLAHRYIHLLAHGVPPERMIALTFSRKAAGEIFDAIVKHLREATSSKTAAERAAQLIGHPGMTRLEFLHLLREKCHVFGNFQ